MASQNINVGADADDGNGESLRSAFIDIRKMFAEVYNQTYTSDTQDLGGATFDLYSKPDLTLVGNTLTLTKPDATTDTVDLSPYLDEDATAVASATLSGSTITFTRLDSSTFDLDVSALLGDITSIAAGDGLTGSNLDSGDATLNVVGGDGITANADEVEVTVDDSTIELSASDGTGAIRIKDDGVTYAKLAAQFTTKATIPSDNDVDFATAAVFEQEMDGDSTYDIENPKVGDVKTLVLEGDGTDRTIAFEMSGSTGETFNKMKGSDDFSFTDGDKNLVQIICVDDTSNSEVFWYSNSVVYS